MRSASDPKLERLGAAGAELPTCKGETENGTSPDSRAGGSRRGTAGFQLVPLARQTGASQGLKMFLSRKEARSF